MIDDPDIQELYSLLADTLNGFNRTHDVQVDWVDFKALERLSAPCFSRAAYEGSVACRTYERKPMDAWYSCIDSSELYPNCDFSVDQSEIVKIRRAWVRMSQQAHREGCMSRCYWLRYPYFTDADAV